MSIIPTERIESMPTVTWRDEYSVNVEEIDLQHQKLIELVNNLHSSVEARISKNKLEELLIELVKFTRIHFSTEEKYMKEYDFPEREAHAKEHRALLDHMDILISMVSNGKSPTFYSDYDISSDWALSHITGFDKTLGTFLNSNNVY